MRRQINDKQSSGVFPLAKMLTSPEKCSVKSFCVVSKHMKDSSSNTQKHDGENFAIKQSLKSKTEH